MEQLRVILILILHRIAQIIILTTVKWAVTGII